MGLCAGVLQRLWQPWLWIYTAGPPLVFCFCFFWIWPHGGGRLGGGGIQEVVNADLRPSGAAVLGT